MNLGYTTGNPGDNVRLDLGLNFDYRDNSYGASATIMQDFQNADPYFNRFNTTLNWNSQNGFSNNINYTLSQKAVNNINQGVAGLWNGFTNAMGNNWNNVLGGFGWLMGRKEGITQRFTNSGLVDPFSQNPMLGNSGLNPYSLLAGVGGSPTEDTVSNRQMVNDGIGDRSHELNEKSRNPLSYNDIIKLARELGISTNELNKYYETGTYIGLKIVSGKIVLDSSDSPKRKAPNDASNQSLPFEYSINEYVGQTQIGGAFDLSDQTTDRINGRFYVNLDAGKWVDVTDVALDHSGMTVGSFLTNDKFASPATEGRMYNGYNPGNTDEIPDQTKPWNPIANKNYEVYKKSNYNNTRNIKYSPNPAFIHEHRGTQNSINANLPIRGIWNRTGKASPNRIDMLFLDRIRNSQQQPINNQPFGPLGF